MQPARFVTLCFLYSGALLLVRHALLDGVQLDLAGIANLGVGITILFVGVARLRIPAEERKPTDWGPMSYGVAILATVLTVVVLAQLFVSW